MPYVARKTVTVLGESYSPGTPVPLDGIPQRLAEKMIDQRRVLWVDGDVDDGPSDGVEVVHRGGRWFDVRVAGKVVNEKGLSREDADALAAEYGAVPA